MQGWLESVAGPEYASALMWTIFALIGLLVLLILIRIVRGMTFGTFVAGGRNRKARLAVMDATAVDSHRRLVLVRRDDVEHLILIGGPSDVVVEQNIRLVPPARRPAVMEEHQPEPAPQPERPRPQPEAQQPRPAATPSAPPAPTAPAPVRAPAAPIQPAPAPVAPRPERAPAPAVAPQPANTIASPPRYEPPVTPARPAPVTTPTYSSGLPNAAASSTPKPAAAQPAHQAADTGASRYVSYIPRPAPAAAAPVPSVEAPTAPPPRPEAAPARKDPHDLDDALLEELQGTLDKDHGKPSGADPDLDSSLDEEMSKLLGELTAPPRR